jgi:cell division protein FtsI/penicillin-binding protein 2
MKCPIEAKIKKAPSARRAIVVSTSPVSHLPDEVGGKTGTLNGRTPAGLTSLFIGLYPVSAPRIAVSTVVVLEDRYYFKAPQLAAEAIITWKQQQVKNTEAKH